MIWVMRILVLALGGVMLLIGVQAMLDPAMIIAQFELGRPGLTGENAVRADMGAFFAGTGLAALAGLWPGRRQWLLAAAAMLALAFVGRAIGVVIAGGTGAIFETMIVEAIGIGLLLAAHRTFRSRPPPGEDDRTRTGDSSRDTADPIG